MTFDLETSRDGIAINYSLGGDPIFLMTNVESFDSPYLGDYIFRY